MAVEAGHIQLLEYNKEVIPELNWMLEDLFCRYGVSIPYYLLDFSFPDYQIKAEWPAPYSPEWLELYRPSLPPWPELQWPDWFGGGFDWFPEFNGFNFNMDWGEWGYDLTWFNELLGLLFDEADLPRQTLPDLSDASISLLNNYFIILYEGIEATRTLSVSDNIAISESLDAKIVKSILSTTGINNQILRSALAASYAAMITEFETDPTPSYDENGQISVEWYYQDSPGYVFDARQGYRTFDTSSVSGVTTAKIRLGTISEVLITAGTENPILEIYEHDYGDSLTWQADWTGGTKIAERTFTASDDGTVVDITIDPSYVNEGGMSKYRFCMTRITDSNYWAEGSNKRHRIITGIPQLLLEF